VGAAGGHAGEGREVGVPVARAGGREVGAHRREGGQGASEERSGEGGRRMPEPERPCGGVARARAGGREVGARPEMHKELLRPAFVVWLASREAATRWREGGRRAAHIWLINYFFAKHVWLINWIKSYQFGALPIVN